MVVGQRQVNHRAMARGRDCAQPLGRAARQAQRRLAARVVHHSHVPEEDARAKPGAERLRASLLCGEPLCIGSRSSQFPPVRLCLLDGREHPVDEALAEAVERFLDSLYRTEVRSKADDRSDEHTSELQSLMRISYAVFCLKKKKT